MVLLFLFDQGFVFRVAEFKQQQQNAPKHTKQNKKTDNMYLYIRIHRYNNVRAAHTKGVKPRTQANYTNITYNIQETPPKETTFITATTQTKPDTTYMYI